MGNEIILTFFTSKIPLPTAMLNIRISTKTVYIVKSNSEDVTCTLFMAYVFT